MIAIIIKYLAWALTNGVAIAGAWFVDFTTKGEDDKKKLTRWGKIALPLAIVPLLLAVGLTIRDDLADAERSKRNEEKEKERDGALVSISETMSKLLQRQQGSEIDLKHVPAELSAQITALYEQRRKLKGEWEDLYKRYSQLNSNSGRAQTAFERQQVVIKMGELAEEIDSIILRLSQLEGRALQPDRRPPLPPGELRPVQK